MREKPTEVVTMREIDEWIRQLYSGGIPEPAEVNRLVVRLGCKRKWLEWRAWVIGADLS